MAETVSGYVEHIIYQNPDNGYTVLELATDEDFITVTGNLGQISEGESISCQGYYVTHPVYGEQFSCEYYEIKEPEDLISVERYLGSGAIKGIGPSLAARIVNKFGEDTLRVLDDEPERLAEVRGISPLGARQIAEQVSEKRELRTAMMYLQKQGVSLSLAVKIYDFYGQEVYSVFEKNPYKLAEDIPGIGFVIADEIARNSGFTVDSDFRIKSAIYYVLISSVSNGHVYLPKQKLYDEASALLGFEIEDFENYLIQLAIEKKVVSQDRESGTIIYPAPYYYMELTIGQRLLDLNTRFDVDEEKVDEVLEYMEEMTGYIRDEDQRSAIINTLKHGVSVITGGPGTGKTTIINALISVFEADQKEKKTVLLAAPTGRAAKRMTEATKREAKTIHRLLEFQGTADDESTVRFLRNDENPLEGNVIIIDEASMVDVFLMNALVKAIPEGARLILVGDANQLPSVGPGNVLKDVIDSGAFHIEALSKIYRQSDAGDIIINAHKINEGENIDVDARSDDFIFVKREEAGRILGSTITLIKEKLPDYVGTDVLSIQVLTPMRKGPLGVINLNKVLQEAINPPKDHKREKEFAHCIFREGDKVMQIKNNYEREWTLRNKKGLAVGDGKGVFNGDLGRIKTINLFSEEIVVVFDEDKEVTYQFKFVDELELAYAVTVHKSQGSEYPAVIVPLLNGPRPLMNRNLIYTAVTRAKNCVVIVGSTDCFQSMVKNNEEQKRFSGLAWIIRGLL